MNNIIAISMIVAFVYVYMIRGKFGGKGFVTRFKVIYLIFIMILGINIIEIITLFNDIPKRYFILLYSMHATLEYCIIKIGLMVKNSDRKSLLICIVEIVIITMLGISFNGGDEIYNPYKISLFIWSIATSVLLSIGLCISTVEDTLSKRKQFTTDEFRQIIFYIFFILFNYLGFICFYMNYVKISEFVLIVKCMTLYKFYNYIISKVVDSSLKELNNNIGNATKTKKELNSILRKRNSILNEISVMIKKSGDRNNELIDSIYGGVFLFYLDRLRYINKKTLKTLNITNDEVLGIEINDFIKMYFDITLDDIKRSGNYIPCIKMKHTDFEVEIFLASIDEISKILYIHDISEVNENKKMREILEEYLQEDEIKKEFFSNISHELKTPINLIFSALQVNQIYFNENNMDGVNKNRKIIKQNCLRLIRTINNFIDANKISEGYLIPNLKAHNIVNIVEEVSMASNKYIKLINNTLTFDAQEEEIYVNCDKEMVTRIMLNILSNSVKYGKQGGKINVSVELDIDNKVAIKVKNDGLKIDKETIPYIFDKFTKLNKTFNRLKEGSGLGLFLTKALVELQGGTIRLTSNSRGNKFTIIMPRAEQLYDDKFANEDWETNLLEEKIDIEFSDIYIE
ncbi:sensor histidine kinase [Clostridium beijerinckii]|uniref:sensor histidine kinase n=1 Tax=Clostridium beijerinckii TaxID=1520 RepID=UPI001FA717DB|nr:HAMP domain-containing sensor histidine kinase [Clostridium beijerinckii]